MTEHERAVLTGELIPKFVAAKEHRVALLGEAEDFRRQLEGAWKALDGLGQVQAFSDRNDRDPWMNRPVPKIEDYPDAQRARSIG